MSLPAELSLAVLLGTARHQAYLDAAGGDLLRAVELYEWSIKLAGSWHSHISYIEVAVRNTIDRELIAWNSGQAKPGGRNFGPEWTAAGNTAPLLYDMVASALREARDNASKEARRRPASHARRGLQPTHDDVVAQLSFGTWSRLVMPPQGASATKANANQAQLWSEGLYRAFPGADPRDRGRVSIGRQLEAIRRLRNRVAHHDNLLAVDIDARLNGSLALLARISPEFPALVMGSNSLRHLSAADPRRRWRQSG